MFSLNTFYFINAEKGLAISYFNIIYTLSLFIYVFIHLSEIIILYMSLFVNYELNIKKNKLKCLCINTYDH